MGRVEFFLTFFLKKRVGWIFFLTFFLKKGWVGSKPPTFFLKHHRVANYNIGRPMIKLVKKIEFISKDE